MYRHVINTRKVDAMMTRAVLRGKQLNSILWKTFISLFWVESGGELIEHLIELIEHFHPYHGLKMIITFYGSRLII